LIACFTASSMLIMSHRGRRQLDGNGRSAFAPEGATRVNDHVEYIESGPAQPVFSQEGVKRGVGTGHDAQETVNAGATQAVRPASRPMCNGLGANYNLWGWRSALYHNTLNILECWGGHFEGDALKLSAPIAKRSLALTTPSANAPAGVSRTTNVYVPGGFPDAQTTLQKSGTTVGGSAGNNTPGAVAGNVSGGAEAQVAM